MIISLVYNKLKMYKNKFKQYIKELSKHLSKLKENGAYMFKAWKAWITFKKCDLQLLFSFLMKKGNKVLFL